MEVYNLDSGYRSDKERQSEATSLMEARLKRMKTMFEDQVIRARLMQLKLRKKSLSQSVIIIGLTLNFF